MSQNITKIKTRIRSVTGAYKVTSAMKLVSTVKLRTWKSKMIANKRYAEEVKEASDSVFNFLTDVDSIFIEGNKKATKNLYVVVSSSLGLCGAYNSNIFKLADVTITKEDDAIILGKKGSIHFKNGEFKQIHDFDNYESIKNTSTIRALGDYLIEVYKTGEYKEVHLIYTEYHNPIVFTSKDLKLLPLSNKDEKDGKKNSVGYEPLLEPSKGELVNTLVPFVVSNLVYSCLLESEVCEQASRSNAMENATDNAEELLNELKIEFNKARQAAITQEIIEIAAAANAL